MWKVIVTIAAKMWTVVLYKANLNGTIVSRETQHTRNMWTKSYSLFLVVLLITIVNSFGQQEGRKCVEGKSYSDGCNTCSCMGGHAACTLMLCYDENGVVLEPQEAPEDFWEKNETR